jgi:hypothetical protein
MQPEKIGPYLISRRIGAGGMGSVFYGTHDETGAEAAIKVLSATTSGNEVSRERFTREIEVLRQLSSPWIVQLLDSGLSIDGLPYFAMEYVSGKPLSEEILEQRRLPWKQVVNYSVQLASALKAAHDAGVIHRDVKPGNVMITDEGQLKLADFGVASLFAASPLTRTGGILGTVDYMSPEQAVGRCIARSDLYSLGAVMYAMLTGRPPFLGRTTADIMHKHQFAMFDRPSRFVPEIPPRLEDLVCQLLAKKPDERPANALAVIRSLERIRQLDEATTSDVEGNAGTGTRAAEQGRTGATAAAGEVADRAAAVAMRDLMRAELEQNRRRGGLLDNTWVLISLLLLLLLFAFQMSRRENVSSTDQLTQGLKRFTQSPGQDWLRIRDEILRPALADGQISELQQEEVVRSIRAADEFEFIRSLQAATESPAERGADLVQSEINRLIRTAFNEYSEGDSTTALAQLQAVRALCAEQSGEGILLSFLDETIEQWSLDQTRPRLQLLEALLSRTAVTASGKAMSKERRAALQAARFLYADQADAVDLLAEIDRVLQQDAQEVSSSPLPPADTDSR